MGVGLNSIVLTTSLSVASASSSSSSSSSSSFTVNLLPRYYEPIAVSPLSLKSPKSCLGLRFRPPIVANRRGAPIVAVRASPDTPDGGGDDDSRPESGDDDDDDDDVLPMNDLALDAKLVNKLEKKLKMKVAKNVRLRRKKLLHKRRLRRKGRWPPSKTKKSTNV